MTPTRAAPMGPRNGTPDSVSAAEAATSADDVGIVLHVVREHGDDDLRLVLEAFDEQRPDRPVDEARGQRLLLGRTAFALEKAAGDLAGGVGLLLVVDGQREEVDAGLRAPLRRRRSPARWSRRTGRTRRRRPGAPCGRFRASACVRPIQFPRDVCRTCWFFRFSLRCATAGLPCASLPVGREAEPNGHRTRCGREGRDGSRGGLARARPSSGGCRDAR